MHPGPHELALGRVDAAELSAFARFAIQPGFGDLAEAFARRRAGSTCWRVRGDRLELIALIDDPTVVRRILSHLDLPTEVPAGRRGATA